MKLLSLFLLILALILEVSITTIPLVFVALLSLAVLARDSWVFVFAFLFGVLLDLALFRPLGLSGIVFLTFLFLVTLYQSKFEIATNYFVLASAFLGSLGYLIILGYNNHVVLQAIISSFLGLILFKSLQRVNKIG